MSRVVPAERFEILDYRSGDTTDVGYARVSSEAQDLTRQVDELTAARCDRIVTEKASDKHGAKRPEWEKLIDPDRKELRVGDRWAVVELSRLDRSTSSSSKLGLSRAKSWMLCTGDFTPLVSPPVGWGAALGFRVRQGVRRWWNRAVCDGCLAEGHAT